MISLYPRFPACWKRHKRIMLWQCEECGWTCRDERP
jgi:rubrerythrin